MTASVISDLTVKSPSLVLAEALRDLLGETPEVYLIEPEAGRLLVERAWLPVFELDATNVTVVSLLPEGQEGQIATRSGSLRTRRTVSIMCSVQRLLGLNPQTDAGKCEMDDLKNYSERVLRACLEAAHDITDIAAAPSTFQSTGHDLDALREWNQFAEVHSINYEVLA